MTSIHIYDLKADSALAELPPLPIGALVAGTLNLLDEAIDLPQPIYITVSDTQSISLQFDPEPSSVRDISRWALRFGGLLTTEPVDGKHGRYTKCQLEFGYYGVNVKAYALIPADAATT